MKLTRVIDNYGAPDVDANTRIAILTALRDKAGNNYFRAWCENEDAMDIMRDWLKAAVMKRDENPELEDTVMPLLQVSLKVACTIDPAHLCVDLGPTTDDFGSSLLVQAG